MARQKPGYIVSVSPKPRRAGLVKLPIEALAILFGEGASVDDAFFVPEDAQNRLITLLVSNHTSLPVVEEGDLIPEVFVTLWSMENRQSDFREFASDSSQ